jgi:hypothetical protein
MRKFFLSVTVLFAAAALMSWGVTGHRAVATIAEHHLSAAAKSAVRELLGDTSLADVSTWPDEILHRQPEYRHTAPWHYLNLPLGLSYAEFETKVKGMGSENVYGALQEQEKVLASTSSTRAEKIEALKFVVHFVGDLHQPMHISREEDKGGNTIQLNYDGKGTNLHALWDSRLIDHEGLTYLQMAEQYDHATPAQVRQWQADPLMQWIWESYQASSRLYSEVDSLKSSSIDDSYYQAHISIIHDRIVKAGIRLAGVLNDIFKNGLAASSTSVSTGSAAGSSMAAPGSTAGNPGAVDARTPVTIEAGEAARHYNEYVKVCAKVYGIKAMQGLTLVNLGAAYPDQLLTVVLRDQAKDAFPNIEGKTVCVTGKLVSYRDKPEIVVTDPAKIAITN